MARWMRFVAPFVIGTACVAHAGPVAAFDYPTRAVRLMIGFAPGGAADVLARQLAIKLGERLGQTVVVENRPGAAGTIAAASVAAATPDGHTLLMGANGDIVIAPQLVKVPYDARTGLTPISLVSRDSGFLLVAHPSFPVATLADLRALSQRQPNVHAYGTPGRGTPHHLAMELYQQEAEIRLVHVPFKGGGDLLPNLLAGQVPLGIVAHAPALPLVRAGKLRAIAVTTRERGDVLPEVPTFAESGYSAVDVRGWFAIFGPPGLDGRIVEKIAVAVRDALGDPVVAERLRAQGNELIGQGPGPLRELVERDHTMWANVIRNAHVHPE